MTEKPINCFISYCYENMDMNVLDLLYKKLKDKRRFPNMHIYFDQQDPSISNWDVFMDKINSSDIVILICTPELKHKIENHMDAAYKEYTYILNHYYMQRKLAEKEVLNCTNVLSIDDIHNFDLIPILFTGKKETSIPNEILNENIRYCDISNLHFINNKVKKRNKLKIIQTQEGDFKKELSKLKARVSFVISYKKGSYVDRYLEELDKLNFQSLFTQTKAEFRARRIVNKGYHKSLFVKTYSYYQVAAQTNYLYMGRKGSGKSALLQVASLTLNDRFRYYIPIEREHIDLVALFNIYNQEIKSDSRFLSKMHKVLSYSWKLYFRMQIIECIVYEYLANKNELPEQYIKDIKEILLPFVQNVNNTDDLERYFQMHPHKEKRHHYFVYAFSSVINIFEKAIKNARPNNDQFWSDIERSFNYSNIIYEKLGPDIDKLLVRLLSIERRKVLITFDDVDSYVTQKFIEGVDLIEFKKFELDFLYCLISVVNDFKQLNKRDILASYFDFVVTISSEHLFEILKMERDAYRIKDYTAVISWTGIELALMLRKRLCVGYKYDIVKTKHSTVQSTLNDVLTNKLSFLPRIVSFSMGNGAKHQMHIFLYVLRFSFWRPRDILRYFAKFLITSHTRFSKDTIIDSEMVRNIVRTSSRSIIETEFINEYKFYIENIEDIIKSFEGCKQIMNFDVLKGRLELTSFVFYKDEIRDLSIIDKIKYLYQLGFIGVYASIPIQKEYNLLSDTAFIFNEGGEIIDRLGVSNCDKLQYTVHPIFQNYINIDMDPTVLVANYTWDYLVKMEHMMNARNNSFIVNI